MTQLHDFLKYFDRSHCHSGISPKQQWLMRNVAIKDLTLTTTNKRRKKVPAYLTTLLARETMEHLWASTFLQFSMIHLGKNSSLGISVPIADQCKAHLFLCSVFLSFLHCACFSWKMKDSPSCCQLSRLCPTEGGLQPFVLPYLNLDETFRIPQCCGSFLHHKFFNASPHQVLCVRRNEVVSAKAHFWHVAHNWFYMKCWNGRNIFCSLSCKSPSPCSPMSGV